MNVLHKRRKLSTVLLLTFTLAVHTTPPAALYHNSQFLSIALETSIWLRITSHKRASARLKISRHFC